MAGEKKAKEPKAPKPPKEPKPPKVKKQKEKGEGQKSNKKALLIVIAGLLVVLIVVGFFAVRLFMNKNKRGTADSSSSKNSSSVVSEEEGDDTDSSSEDAPDETKPEEEVSSSEEASTSEDSSSEEAAPEGETPAAIEVTNTVRTAAIVEPAWGKTSAKNKAPEKQAQPEKPFEFSEETFQLPSFSYQTGDSLELAVHRDIQSYLNEKDNRPGVTIPAAVVAARVDMGNGTVRALVYVWGNRYAIAENTLFDYGNMVGPCAMDYTVSGGYQLQKIEFAQAGDGYEDSVHALCGGREDIAKAFVRQAYDLELRGQMLRNVRNYIAQNRINVDYFRAGGMIYRKDGTLYSDPAIEQLEQKETVRGESQSSSEPAQNAESGAANPAQEGGGEAGTVSQTAAGGAPHDSSDALRADYLYYQGLPL